MLAQLRLKSAPGRKMKWDCWTRDGKSQTVVATSLQQPVSTTTSRIELLNSMGRTVSEPTDHRAEGSGLRVYFVKTWCSNAVKVDNDDNVINPLAVNCKLNILRPQSSQKHKLNQ